MQHFEPEMKTRDGLILRGNGWAPESAPRAVLCLVHGHGEHTGRYAHVGQALTDAGFALMGFDLRGHGRSEGARGHTPSYDVLMDDVADMLQQVRARYADVPLFLYGHSMGGNLVINYALRRKSEVVGVIATGPWLRLAFEPSPVQVILARLMDKIYPAFTQNSNLETAALSHDQDVVQAYENDPLVHSMISARLFAAMYESGLWALEHADALSRPMLLSHGSADRLTSAQASRDFAARAGDLVTLHIWNEWYHEIHNEKGNVAFFEVMTDWMQTHLPS